MSATVAAAHPLDGHFRLAADESPAKSASELMLTSGTTITGVITEYFPDQQQVHVAEKAAGTAGYNTDWVLDIRHVIGIRWA